MREFFFRHTLPPLFALLLCYPYATTYPQPERIHAPKIRTAHLLVDQRQLYLPVILLEEQKRVSLDFDYFGEYQSALYAKVVICDETWKVVDDISSLYMSGAMRLYMNEFEYSNAMYEPYVHIHLPLFSTLSLLRSGNYRIDIYEGSDEAPLYTQALIVAEGQDKLTLDITNSTLNFNPSSAFQLTAKTKITHTRILNPIQNLKLYLLQNSDWNTWKKATSTPIGSGEENEFTFGSMGELQFKRYAPFRYIQMDNFNVRGLRASAAFMQANEPLVMVDPDFPSRVGLPSHPYIAFPGYSTTLLHLSSLNKDTYASYGVFHFVYASPRRDAPLYIVGQFNQFVMDSSSLMHYNPSSQQYESRQWLKQGHHQYHYVFQNAQEPYAPPVNNDAPSYPYEHLLGILYYDELSGKTPRVLAVGELNF